MPYRTVQMHSPQTHPLHIKIILATTFLCFYLAMYRKLNMFAVPAHPILVLCVCLLNCFMMLVICRWQ